MLTFICQIYLIMPAPPQFPDAVAFQTLIALLAILLLISICAISFTILNNQFQNWGLQLSQFGLLPPWSLLFDFHLGTLLIPLVQCLPEGPSLSIIPLKLLLFLLSFSFSLF